jgi:hypothetical protein
MDTDVARFVAGCLKDKHLVKVVSQGNDTIQADLARIGSRIQTSVHIDSSGSIDTASDAGSKPPTPTLSPLEREVYALRFAEHGESFIPTAVSMLSNPT